MGQKTHPVGYRLSVNKKWKSNWFASKNSFSDDLEEDLKIRKYIFHRLPNAGISKIEPLNTFPPRILASTLTPLIEYPVISN